jgi:thiamine-phosphate pyrophosphorylase
MSTLEAQLVRRRKLLAAARAVAPRVARNGRALPPVFFLTDPQRTPDPVAIAARLAPGWGVVYRHFGSRDRREIARRLATVCRRRRLVLLIAADPELAWRTGADGVHWPAARLKHVRPRRPNWIESASAHSRRDLVKAKGAGVDLVFLSTVFSSNSPSAGAAIGPLRFRRLATGDRLPAYALGGVNAESVATIRPHAFAAIEGLSAVWAPAGRQD